MSEGKEAPDVPERYRDEVKKKMFQIGELAEELFAICDELGGNIITYTHKTVKIAIGSRYIDENEEEEEGEKDVPIPPTC